MVVLISMVIQLGFLVLKGFTIITPVGFHFLLSFTVDWLCWGHAVMFLLRRDNAGTEVVTFSEQRQDAPEPELRRLDGWTNTIVTRAEFFRPYRECGEKVLEESGIE